MDTDNSEYERFGQQALAALDAAQSIVRFWEHRDYHPEWPKITSRHPWWRSRSGRTSAIADRYWTLRREGRRQDDALLARLQKLSHKAQTLQNQVEDEVGGEWLRERDRDFRPLRSEFAASYPRFELKLAGLLDKHGYKCGNWKGTSACDVLLQIANRIVECLDDPGLSFDNTDLRPDTWKQLRDDVMCEVAELPRAPRQLPAPAVTASPAPAPAPAPDTAAPPTTPEPASAEALEDDEEMLVADAAHIAAERLGDESITKDAVRGWTRRKDDPLPHRKAGRKTFVKLRDVLDEASRKRRRRPATTKDDQSQPLEPNDETPAADET